jgi:hypothetical protein
MDISRKTDEIKNKIQTLIEMLQCYVISFESHYGAMYDIDIR